MLIEKSNLPLVAMDFMNETHLEDVEIINDLYDLIEKYQIENSNENKILINNAYEKWINHTIEHFKAEEVLMEEKRFPPYFFHKSEHDNCLNRMSEIYKTWNETEDITILKEYFNKELLSWLVNHIQTMDTVTAMFFKTGMSPCSAH